jgi:hypothetical protein
MTTESKFEQGVLTLVEKAKHDAAVSKTQYIGAHVQHRSNNRFGFGLATEAIGPVANKLIDDLVAHYATTLKQHPKSDRSALKRDAVRGFTDFIDSTKDYLLPNGAFAGDVEVARVYAGHMVGETDRYVKQLGFKLEAASPRPVAWTKRLMEERPLLWNFMVTLLLVTIGGGLVVTVGGGLWLAKLTSHPAITSPVAASHK